MLNTIGSLIGAQSIGLLDCVTYTAGVSGDFVCASGFLAFRLMRDT